PHAKGRSRRASAITGIWTTHADDTSFRRFTSTQNRGYSCLSDYSVYSARLRAHQCLLRLFSSSIRQSLRPTPSVRRTPISLALLPTRGAVSRFRPQKSAL